jgi:Ca-activated chloride channel family protein
MEIGMLMRPRGWMSGALISAVALTVLVNPAIDSTVRAQSTPAFKTGVERVALAATVRDGRGRLVTNLTARDFELLDTGRSRPLLAVWTEPSPASVALLIDASGSMATKLARARETAQYLLASLQPNVDEAALYSFDTTLSELRPFSTKLDRFQDSWDHTRAYGETSLWDAIASTARRVADRRNRRALIVITDGVDSASHLQPSEVSAIASSLDVPVYLLVIAFLTDEEPSDASSRRGPLADLAAWTGGDMLVVRDAVTARDAAQRIISELQHQYLIAFEPNNTPGWHPLVLRTKTDGLFVRVRSGYVVDAGK